VNTNVIGLLLSVAIAVWAVLTSAKSPAIYMNLAGLVLVVGGTFTVALFAYKVSELKNIVYVALKIFMKDSLSHQAVIRQLIAISKSNTPKGQYFAKFSRSAHPFISDGLRLIDNDFSKDDIEEIMTSMILERKMEFTREIEIVNTLAKYPPAFGMVGTVLGLVAMLDSITTSSNAATIGPSMAIALATTFYGLVMANYILSPFADNLSNRLKTDMAMRRIVMKGILLIKVGQDPIFVEESLNAHVLPHLRVRQIQDIKRAA
jgi:chemotaxis protein MotA